MAAQMDDLDDLVLAGFESGPVGFGYISDADKLQRLNWTRQEKALFCKYIAMNSKRDLFKVSVKLKKSYLECHAFLKMLEEGSRLHPLNGQVPLEEFPCAPEVSEETPPGSPEEDDLEPIQVGDEVLDLKALNRIARKHSLQVSEELLEDLQHQLDIFLSGVILRCLHLAKIRKVHHVNPDTVYRALDILHMAQGETPYDLGGGQIEADVESPETNEADEAEVEPEEADTEMESPEAYADADADDSQETNPQETVPSDPDETRGERQRLVDFETVHPNGSFKGSRQVWRRFFDARVLEPPHMRAKEMDAGVDASAGACDAVNWDIDPERLEWLLSLYQEESEWLDDYDENPTRVEVGGRSKKRRRPPKITGIPSF